MFSTEIFIDNLSPNITGYIPVAFKGGSATTSGAFNEEIDVGNRSASAGGGSGYYNITFNAQSESNFYDGETIQPDSAYSLMIIRA